MDEECAVSWCNKRLERENELWKGVMPQFINALESIVSSLADKLLLTVTPDAMDALIQSLDTFGKRSTELSNQYSLKVTCEHQLPTATKRLRTTNECLLACLNSMAKSATTLVDALKSKRNELQSFTERTAIIRPTANHLNDMAKLYGGIVGELVRLSKLFQLHFSLSNRIDCLRPRLCPRPPVSPPSFKWLWRLVKTS